MDQTDGSEYCYLDLSLLLHVWEPPQHLLCSPNIDLESYPSTVELCQALQAGLQVLLHKVPLSVRFKPCRQEVLQHEDICKLIPRVAAVDDLWYWETQNIWSYCSFRSLII